MIKSYFFTLSIAASLIFTGCSTKKTIIKVEDLTDDKILIIGVIEFDYTELENKKKISGIDLFIDSNEKFSDFELAEDSLPDDHSKEFQFIRTIGNKGNYELCYKKADSQSAEADNLLTNLDMERNMSSTTKNILQKYIINDGKIVNIGKLVVKYSGGIMENSRITYNYSFHQLNNDTTALYAFKQTYPEIYEKCKNDIYTFKSEFDTCIEYVLNHISEGKKLRLQEFISDNPERVNVVFKDLNEENKNKYVEDIEKYSFEQLDEFLLIKQ